MLLAKWNNNGSPGVYLALTLGLRNQFHTVGLGKTGNKSECLVCGSSSASFSCACYNLSELTFMIASHLRRLRNQSGGTNLAHKHTCTSKWDPREVVTKSSFYSTHDIHADSRKSIPHTPEPSVCQNANSH